MTLPGVTCEVAFSTSNPLATSPTWTAVSSDVLAFSTRRGKAHELDRTQPGTATITLDNGARSYDPANTSGAYYPNVQPMKMVRLRTTAPVAKVLFRGYVDDWEQDYGGRPVKAGGAQSVVHMHAVDAYTVLSRFVIPTLYSAEVSADEPVIYFPLTDALGATQIPNTGSDEDLYAFNTEAQGASFDSVLGTRAGVFYGQTCLDARSPGVPGGGIAPECMRVATTADLSDKYHFLEGKISSVRGYSFEAWVMPDSVAAGQAHFLSIEGLDLPGDPLFELGRNGSALRSSWRKAGSATYSLDIAAGVFTAAAWSHVVVVLNTEEGSLRSWVDGVDYGIDPIFANLPVSNYGATPALNIGAGSDPASFTGKPWDGGIAHLAIYDYPLSAERIATHYAAGIAGLDVIHDQLPGDVIGKILDAIGWPSALRTIDTGTTPITLAPEGNALELIQQIAEDGDYGRLFMAEPSVDSPRLTYLSRATLEGKISSATFGDETADTPYADLVLRNDDQDIWPIVVASSENLEPITVENAGAVTTFGPRTLSTPTTFLALESDLQGLADGLLALYDGPATRPVSVKLPGGSGLSTQLSLELGDRVLVHRTPPGGGSQIAISCQVEGISHDCSAADGLLVTTLDLVPAWTPATAARVGDATYGLVGSAIVGW